MKKSVGIKQSLFYFLLGIVVFPVCAAESNLILSELGDFNQPSESMAEKIVKTPSPDAPNLAKPKVDVPYDVNQPLTVADLFKVPVKNAPSVLLAQAKIERLQAQAAGASAQNSTHLNLEGRLSWREYQNQAQDNPRLVLHLSKNLYDGGQLSQAKQAAEIAAQAGEQSLWLKSGQYRQALLKAYFQVLLADMQYRVLNERMAVVYVGLDKAKDQNETGEVSDIELAKKQYEYQQILTQRSQAEMTQRQTRLTLANLLGFPDAIPDKLQVPNLNPIHQMISHLPDLEVLQKIALQRSPALLALQKQVAAQQAKMASVKAKGGSRINADAWVGALSAYPERFEGHWRLDLNVVAPLYDAGESKADIAYARADLHQALAQLQAKTQQIRDAVADDYFQLKLAQRQQQQNQTYGDYADLYLDYSRALYEWEEKTDLGDAMVRLSEVDAQALKNELQMALAWTDLLLHLGIEPAPDWQVQAFKALFAQTGQTQ